MRHVQAVPLWRLFVMTRVSLSVGLLGIALTAPCHAAFTSFTVEYRGNIGSRDVYQVFANFDDPNNVLLNVSAHTVLSGSMASVLHSDSTNSWNPANTGPTEAANDSFVTITGLFGSAASTGFAPTWGGTGSSIPNGQGWFDSFPPTPVLIGDSLRVMIMQVALASGASGYSASLNVGYKVNTSAATPSFGSGTYTIPAPGAVFLLGTIAATGRRRFR